MYIYIYIWCVAMCCNAPQHTATHYTTILLYFSMMRFIHTSSVLQRVATHCNTLQHTATHCNTLQHTPHDTHMCSMT